MSYDEELRHREIARRKALWVLASILPGAPKTLDILDFLDDIELRERHDMSSLAQALSVEQLRDGIPTEPHPIGCPRTKYPTALARAFFVCQCGINTCPGRAICPR